MRIRLCRLTEGQFLRRSRNLKALILNIHQVAGQLQPEKKMTKEEIINYIREHDAFFSDAHLEDYPFHELMLIKISIDVEKEKMLYKDYRSMERMGGF